MAGQASFFFNVNSFISTPVSLSFIYKYNAMKNNNIFIFLLLFFAVCVQGTTNAQDSPGQKFFPEGTIIHGNIAYANDAHKKHLLDIYLPKKQNGKLPLVVWIHGGAWMLNDKYADMGYMKNTLKGFIDSGYAVASIDYRYSTEAIFPAQIRDCNQAIEFLYQHAAEYNIDNKRIAMIGFSAGGHLASLLALSHNNNVKDFYPGGTKPHFNIRCVLDFYGPSDFLMLANTPDTSINNERNPVSILLGTTSIKRPDIARKASPVTYIDKNDPPFFIVQGEKDESVPNTQSIILSSWLKINGVYNELTVVPGAPHYGEMFDAESIRKDLLKFLRIHLK
ncbi:MAG: alpha/beta hydrolase [Chitinophagaceae bacterium]|nr:alpha/beta hydrolase [Chitinophagaceae bacterium]